MEMAQSSGYCQTLWFCSTRKMLFTKAASSHAPQAMCKHRPTQLPFHHFYTILSLMLASSKLWLCLMVLQCLGRAVHAFCQGLVLSDLPNSKHLIIANGSSDTTAPSLLSLCFEYNNDV
jgi:hypothetical protein